VLPRRREGFVVIDAGSFVRAPAFEESGQSGSPVVFVHSLAGSRHDWTAVRRLLPASCRTIAYDSESTRGADGAPSAPLSWSIDDLVAELELLLDHLALDRAHLVGASMGGGVIQHFALAHPERVASLVLVSTSSSFSPVVRARFGHDAEVAMRDGMGALADELTRRWFSPQFMLSHADEVAEVREAYRSLPPQGFARRCWINATRDLTSRLPEISSPVLYVAGAKDPGFDVAEALAYLQVGGPTEIVLLAGRSHCLEREAPHQLARLISGFVAERPRSSQ
jgi:pimeloyl-ACP methyl ester carboxylesterase